MVIAVNQAISEEGGRGLIVPSSSSPPEGIKVECAASLTNLDNMNSAKSGGGGADKALSSSLPLPLSVLPLPLSPTFRRATRAEQKRRSKGTTQVLPPDNGEVVTSLTSAPLNRSSVIDDLMMIGEPNSPCRAPLIVSIHVPRGHQQ